MVQMTILIIQVQGRLKRNVKILQADHIGSKKNQK